MTSLLGWLASARSWTTSVGRRCLYSIGVQHLDDNTLTCIAHRVHKKVRRAHDDGSVDLLGHCLYCSRGWVRVEWPRPFWTR